MMMDDRIKNAKNQTEWKKIMNEIRKNAEEKDNIPVEYDEFT